MENKEQKELPMCEMCGDDWIYELDDDIYYRMKNYKSIEKNKRCISCCREFGISRQ